MTETAKTERAKIVRWLRILPIDAYSTADAADEIEAGTHLKKPEPSILASDWKEQSNVGH